MLKKIKILIVEDSPTTCEAIKDTLSGLACEFTWAESGEQALSHIATTAFDVIIMDIRLPGIDGIETFRMAKALRPNLAPVIALTAFPTTEYAVAFGRLEVFHFLPKSALEKRLKDTVVKAANFEPGFNDARIKRCFKYNFPGCLYKIPVQQDLVFVGMPFALNDIYRYGIKPTIETFKLKCWRADEDLQSGDISCKICGTLQSCRFAVMDLSGLNPNVCIELGLAYGYGKRVILIKHRDTPTPTDLAGLEFVEYTDIDSLREKLPGYIEAAMQPSLRPGA
jgi:CheY-like chemotaxis protein